MAQFPMSLVEHVRAPCSHADEQRAEALRYVQASTSREQAGREGFQSQAPLRQVTQFAGERNKSRKTGHRQTIPGRHRTESSCMALARHIERCCLDPSVDSVFLFVLRTACHRPDGIVSCAHVGLGSEGGIGLPGKTHPRCFQLNMASSVRLLLEKGSFSSFESFVAAWKF